MDLAKVWPLRGGLTGCTPDGSRAVSLQAGVPGFMEYAEAVQAQTRGELQLMAGQTPQSLKTPVYEDRSLTSEEKPPVPERNSRRPPPATGSSPPRKRKTYNRRDIVAQKADS